MISGVSDSSSKSSRSPEDRTVSHGHSGVGGTRLVSEIAVPEVRSIEGEGNVIKEGK